MKVKKVLFLLVIFITLITMIGCKANLVNRHTPVEEDNNKESNEENNNIVTLDEDYNRFDKISGFEGSMEHLSMIGEVDNKLILSYIPSDEGKKALLMLVNNDNFTVEKQVEFIEKYDYTHVKFVDQKIFILLKQKILTFDTNLEKLEDIPLPNIIIEKINSEKVYDDYGYAIDYFGAYDVSSDMTKLIYTDNDGVKLFNTLDNSELLLSETVEIKGSSLIKHSYHSRPYFIANDKKVITIREGYEGIDGYNVCDIENNTTIFIDRAGYGEAYKVYYDTGLLLVNEHFYDSKTQTSQVKTLYLDFKSLELIEINLEDTGDTSDIRESGYSYVGQNYASFITYKWDENDMANSMFYINQLDLNTLTIEPKLISLKTPATNILGVLKDGRTVFYYEGICITK